MSTMLTLGSVFPGLFEDQGRAITGLTMDSRAVTPGHVFVAYAGARTDGARFIADAVARGAVAVVAAGARPDELAPGIAFASVADPRRVLALSAAARARGATSRGDCAAANRRRRHGPGATLPAGLLRGPRGAAAFFRAESGL
jgi:UDP-N-acetylmuramyl tripeptide synthase